MKLLPWNSKAASHQCGNPPTFHIVRWVEALGRWRCTGCGRIVG